MTIQEISSSAFSPDRLKGKRAKESEKPTSPVKDSVKLSDEAVTLFEAEQTKRIREIQERIKEGFYFRREVTEKIVEEMLRDVKSGLNS